MSSGTTLNTQPESRDRLAQIRQAEADLEAKTKKEYPTKLVKYSKRGRKNEGKPKKTTSRKAIAEETGVSAAEQVRVERHVALAERYPFLRRTGNGWKRKPVPT
jgi:hypothetical protein